MLVDHEKFMALLADNAGISAEEAEKRFKKLLAEMTDAFNEDNAYEVEGFGIFSKLGQAVHFMPSKELETEINYKYAGMSPIELPGFEESKKQAGETKTEEEPDSFDSEFDAGEEVAPAEEETLPDDVFSEFLQMQKDEAGEEDESADTDKPASDSDAQAEEPQSSSGAGFDETFAGLIDDFDQDEIDAAGSDFGFTDSGQEEEAETPLAEDPFAVFDAADTSDKEADSMQEDDASEPAGAEAEAGPETGSTAEHEVPAKDDEDPDSGDKPEGPEWGIDAHDEDDKDKEAAFSGLFSEPKTGGDEKPVKKEEEEFIPVVQNVSAKAAGKTEAPEKEGKSKKPAKKEEANPVVSVVLYMIIIVLITGIMGYVLVHFNMIDISRFTKSKTPVAQTVPQQQTPQMVAEQPSEAPGTEQSTTVSGNFSDEAQGQEPAAELETAAQPEAGPADFGLTGAVNAAANQGYTIVLFHLSNRNNAERELDNLHNNGLRAMIKEIPSVKYGVLYRVSIGQFRTAADAAIAADENRNLITGEYSITKIN